MKLSGFVSQLMLALKSPVTKEVEVEENVGCCSGFLPKFGNPLPGLLYLLTLLILALLLYKS